MKMWSLIVWASGLVEFVTSDNEPDGAVLVCTVRGKNAADFLLGWISADIVLRDFGDRIAPSVPEIGDDMEQFAAMDALIDWENNLRASMATGCPELYADIVWTRQ